MVQLKGCVVLLMCHTVHSTDQFPSGSLSVPVLHSGVLYTEWFVLHHTSCSLHNLLPGLKKNVPGQIPCRCMLSCSCYNPEQVWQTRPDPVALGVSAFI
eukprot:jgi/Botrbrau1/19875/Bobra.0711s0001.1